MMRRRLARTVGTMLMLAIVAGCRPLGLFAPASAPRTPAEQFGPLALVYINAKKVSAPEVWLTTLDGTTHRSVATYTLGTLPVDLRGTLLALDAHEQLVVLDLATGAEQRVPTGNVVPNAHIGVDGSVYVSFNEDDPKTGRATAVLSRLDMATGERADITRLDARGIGILWDNPETNELL